MSASAMAMVGDPPIRTIGACNCIMGPGPYGCNACGAPGYLRPISIDPFTAPWKYQTPTITTTTYTSNASRPLRFKSTVPALRPEDV